VRRERCQPTRREWALITSSRPVVRRFERTGAKRAVEKTAGVCKHLFVDDPQTPRPPFGPGLTDVSQASEGGQS
jgi:hypothetical protein